MIFISDRNEENLISMQKLFFPALFVLVVCVFSISSGQAQTRGWGYNLNGALATGSTANQTSPQTVSALPNATGVGAGVDHTLFLRADGTLAAAGLNDLGQFGVADPAFSSVPVAVPGLTNVVQVSSGAFHSVALLADGTVRVWGFNGDGQIGDGTTSSTGCMCVKTPTAATISNVVQIEAGAYYTLALKADGTVWAWGYNEKGQLGDNSTTDRATPVQVGAGVAGFTNIIAVSAGDNHSLALKADGSVWVWGSNEFGQIGNGTASNTNQLTPVQNTTLANIVHISAGVFHSLALNKAGRVFVWGDNFNGQVGNGTAGGEQTTPVQNATLANVLEIETAGFTNYARLTDGSVYAWGLNETGQIGNGTNNPSGCQCQTTPVQTSVGAGSAAIAAGWFHAFALKPVIALAPGVNQTLRGDSVRFNFADVTGAGNLSYTAVSAASVAGSRTVPAGYTIQNNQPAYDVTTTAATNGNIDVCIASVNEFSQAEFATLKILHGEGANWVDRTNSFDFQRRQICARVTSLATFVLAQTVPILVTRRAPFDFDGDGKTDVGIFRPSDGSWWYTRSSSTDFRVFRFGLGSDQIVPGDYTGDGKADLGVFRPSSGEWFIQRSEDNSFFSFPFGASGDVPAPADYDGDGKTDAAIFRPSNGTWYILNSNGSGTSIVQFGSAEDKPVPADYDGDSKADIAIFRPSDGSWWYLQSTNQQFKVFRFGLGTDKPVQGDYTGDGRAELAIFRPSTGEWYFQRSEDNSYFSVPFGGAGDIPAPGDYDGDGKFDTAVFRPSNADWYVQRSTAGILITNFGTNGDRPIPNAYVP